jgi:hypothetical protein
MKRLLVFCGVCLLVACEKTINIEPTQQPDVLVVEAQIETGVTPIVSLSTSINYFSEIDTAILNASFVHGAKVTVSDGLRAVQLRETTATQGNIKVYYYISPQTSPATSMIGVNGRTYTLTIETGGQTYKSVTTIPQPAKKVDSIWWKPAPASSDTTKVVLMAKITDPPGFGNYIRYFTRVNREGFYPGYNSVYDDQITDGITYDIQVDQGVSKNEVQNQGRNERGYFSKGDTVTLKHCNIDKATYDFWRTWEFSYQSVGNPFSSPGKVIGNISNGALGSFSGYAVQQKSMIIPK